MRGWLGGMNSTLHSSYSQPPVARNGLIYSADISAAPFPGIVCCENVCAPGKFSPGKISAIPYKMTILLLLIIIIIIIIIKLQGTKLQWQLQLLLLLLFCTVLRFLRNIMWDSDCAAAGPSHPDNCRGKTPGRTVSCSARRRESSGAATTSRTRPSPAGTSAAEDSGWEARRRSTRPS